eukprot:gb/GECH01005938.1/.p1 GENE.gb/GECH01005938.1/~~gb/GECH01005938.1/.p1  ORF type:complete len:1157 (+),score=317.75 gb/GECH01005938.1/:1-3471(+)
MPSQQQNHSNIDEYHQEQQNEGQESIQEENKSTIEVDTSAIEISSPRSPKEGNATTEFQDVTHYVNDQGEEGNQDDIKVEGSLPEKKHFQIDINDPEKNRRQKFAKNYIRTTRYTFLTFLPKNLFEQLRRISNIYFLVTMSLSLIPGVSPIFPITAILPPVSILSITALKDGIEDFFRWRSDCKANSIPVNVVRDGKDIQIKSAQVRVGDIVRVDRGNQFPADMLLLSSSLPNNLAYMETSNLDGETNLKEMCGVKETAKYINAQSLSRLRGQVEIEEPSPALHTFQGRLRMSDPTPDDSETAVSLPESPDYEIGLSIHNLLLRGAMLKNTKFVYGLVVYAGKQTKMFMNLAKTKNKFSALDRKMNRTLLALLLIQQIIVCIFVILSAIAYSAFGSSAFYLAETLPSPSTVLFYVRQWITYFILLNLMIPMSLFVSLELIKVFQAKFIEFDDKMSHGETRSTVRSSNLNEELGQIDFVFSDKTGTLTENDMRFQAISVGPIVYDEKTDPGCIRESLGDKFEDIKNYDLFEMCMAISICQSVIPELEEDGNINYDGQSTDEVALLEALHKQGITFKNRVTRGVQLNVFGKDLFFRELAMLEFDSDRKRMSVLVQREDDSYVLYSKGADNVMLALANTDDPHGKSKAQETERCVDEFSNKGLRTMIVCKRELDPDFAQDWLMRYRMAAADMYNRQEKIGELSEEMEIELETLGATGIEDRLQENVPNTLSFLSRAGIRVWVLTGDKRQTAESISRSANLIETDIHVEHIEAQDDKECNDQLKSLKSRITSSRDRYCVIIDGKSLFCAMKYCYPDLVSVAKKCHSFICCRVTPMQKAKVVEMAEKEIRCRALAIGDGANDVTMIQSASVGVGVIGREGNQAARAADYAIPRFKHLVRLLAVHGRFSLLRNSKFILYSFYKNNLLVFTTIIFAFFNGFSGHSYFDSWFLTLYNTLFVVLPPMVFGVFEKDLPDHLLEQHPEVYPGKVKGKYFNWKTFVLWFLLAAYQAAVSFFLLYGAEKEGPFLPSGRTNGIWFHSTMAAIVVEFVAMFKYALETRHWTILTVGAIILSILPLLGFLVVYTAFPIFIGSSNMYWVVYEILSCPRSYLIMLLIFVTSCAPDFIIKFVQRNWFPDERQKLLVKWKQAKKKEKKQEVELETL